MSRIYYNLIKVLSLSLLVMAVGCTEPEAGMDVDPQADRIQQLEAELNQAALDRAAAEDRILALNAENEKLRDQLADSSKAAPEGWQSVPGGEMITIEGTVLFDSGKAVIKSSGKKTLDNVAGAINEKFSGYDIYVFGHTDNEPIRKSKWTDNEELSCQRALSVLRYLRKSGVSQEMCAGGWGEQRPVADNTSAKARQSNRRVQIFAMQKTS
ncbi:MAG: OmpA/MotB family protein [Planctomycetota bacterium]|jgi:chemotaxis protein MotB